LKDCATGFAPHACAPLLDPGHVVLAGPASLPPSVPEPLPPLELEEPEPEPLGAPELPDPDPDPDADELPELPEPDAGPDDPPPVDETDASSPAPAGSGVELGLALVHAPAQSTATPRRTPARLSRRPGSRARTRLGREGAGGPAIMRSASTGVRRLPGRLTVHAPLPRRAKTRPVADREPRAPPAATMQGESFSGGRHL
jgi:hypothetical protein